MNHRQGVIFDAEEPDISHELLPRGNPVGDASTNNHRSFVAQEETPLQRPRPPERTTSTHHKNVTQRWSQRLSVIYGVGKRSEAQLKCKDIACVVLLPSILLSLVLIGVCSLLIYLHLLHEYHSQIDKLQAELQAARDKDGVFLPKDIYDQQIKEKASAQALIDEKNLRLKTVDKELQRLKDQIAETTSKLEETSFQRDKTQRALDCTRTVLHKTEGNRADQVHKVAKHIDNECKLSQQAQLLMTVSDEATKDVKKMQGGRKKLAETSASTKILDEEFKQQGVEFTKLEHIISGHVEAQSGFCQQYRSDIDAHAERRADERSQLTSTYGETVSKLIQTMGDIERVASEQMYTEQSWVEQLLKRVRNEADSATNDFHAYLIDQLLAVSTKILSALQKQDKSVQELSAKLEKNFAGLSQKLEAYMAEQSSLRMRKAKAEADLFAGLGQKNAALNTVFGDDIKATEEYVKKSKAFNDQMMSLIKARAKEEETFLAGRNATVTKAKTLTATSAEAASAAQDEAQEIGLSVMSLETGFKDTNYEIMMRMKADKANTIEVINQSGQEAAKATAQLRSDAEAFAQKAKDQWASHYARTETLLREKSDKSSGHVSSLQSMTGTARKAMLEGQGTVEEAIENWRRADERATRNAHAIATSQCNELNDFGSQLRNEIRSTGAQNNGKLNKRNAHHQVHQPNPKYLNKRNNSRHITDSSNAEEANEINSNPTNKSKQKTMQN